MAVRFDASGEHFTASAGLPGSIGTYTLWEYLDTNPSQQKGLLSLGGGGRFNVLLVDPGPFLFAMSEDGSNYPDLVYAGTTTGAWYGIGVSWNGTSASWVRVNEAGQIQETGSSSAWLPPSTATSLLLGTLYWDTPHFFPGRLASVKMWNAQLSQAEMQAELGQYAPVRTTNLMRAHFHPGFANSADYSGNGRTLSGGSGAATVAGPNIPEGGGTTGALAATAPAPTGIATGQVRASGTVTGSLPAPTGTVTGGARATGQVTAALPPPTGDLAAETLAAGALAGTLPAVTGSMTGGAAAIGAIEASAPAPVSATTADVAAAATVDGTAPAAAAALTATATADGAVDIEAPPAAGELTGQVTVTGALDTTGPAPTATLTGLVGDNRLTGALPVPVGEVTGTSSTSGALAGTLATPVGEITASTDNTGQLAGALPPPTATVTGTTTVTGQLAGTLPAPELTAETGTSERDISLVANLAPTAWHSTVGDAEWRGLLTATEWAGSLQALAWLAGVDEPGWAVSDLVADQWAGLLHLEQWAALAAPTEWAVSTPWITTPGETGPNMRLNSKEFVKVTVTPSKDPATGVPLDISADEVEMCVTLATHPEELDWQPAAWVGAADPSTGALACRLLVQPSALGLTANSQPGVFVRVHDNPEVPVLQAGRLSIN